MHLQFLETYVGLGLPKQDTSVRFGLDSNRRISSETHVDSEMTPQNSMMYTSVCIIKFCGVIRIFFFEYTRHGREGYEGQKKTLFDSTCE